MDADELDAALGPNVLRRVGRPRPQQFAPEVAAARHKEQNLRSSRAQNMARAALVRLHREQFNQLRARALERIYADCGPLPGDEVAS
jgi:hypothetical protein